jgi:LmbE family N-acetylglucosaminyl deacetylase
MAAPAPAILPDQAANVIISAALILGACCLAAMFVLLKALRLRTAIYRYEVNSDQHYAFPPSRTSRVTARLLNGRLDVPPRTHTGGVVLLELRIRSTLLGHWFEPYLRIESSRGRWRQPFERAGSGLRYVDLSQILLDGETQLRLGGHHLNICDQAVVLYYLQHEIDLDHQRILVIGTHPDDAELAAFGVYADRDAYVITLTAGEAGEPGAFERFKGASVYLEKGRNRAWNSVTVPMLGGLSINRTANLGYFDGTLQAMKQHPETPVQSISGPEFLDAFGQSQDPSLLESRCHRRATWANLVVDLEHLIRSVQPDIIVTPYPRLDWHPDHKMSTVALVEALKNLNWRRGSLLLYANHFCSSDRYPFGQAGDLVSLPPGVDDIYFDGIVSDPLDAKRQARKHMALDAMIDLRPVIRVDSFRSVATAFYKVLKSTVTDGHISYFRQAVRANELFFEVRVSSLYEPGVTERIFG